MTNVTLVGNLAGDPELRFTPQGKAIVKFTVMTSKSRKNDAGQWENVDVTGWTCTAFDAMAENVAESLAKGDAVIVLGEAVWRSWEKDDGSKGGRMEVKAWNVGADLKRGTAKVTKVNRANAASAPADDPWSTDAAPF